MNPLLIVLGIWFIFGLIGSLFLIAEWRSDCTVTRFDALMLIGLSIAGIMTFGIGISEYIENYRGSEKYYRKCRAKRLRKENFKNMINDKYGNIINKWNLWWDTEIK